MYDAKARKRLQEMFGEPLSPEKDWHKKVELYKGDAPSGAPGLNPAVEVCPGCGMMRIEGKCGCGDEMVCHQCGMMHVDGKCGCEMSEAAKTCECGMNQGEGCGCTHLDEDDDSYLDEGKKKKKMSKKEKVIKGLKKAPGVKNPWAVWQSQKKKGYDVGK